MSRDCHEIRAASGPARPGPAPRPARLRLPGPRHQRRPRPGRERPLRREPVRRVDRIPPPGTVGERLVANTPAWARPGHLGHRRDPRLLHRSSRRHHQGIRSVPARALRTGGTREPRKVDQVSPRCSAGSRRRGSRRRRNPAEEAPEPDCTRPPPRRLRRERRHAGPARADGGRQRHDRRPRARAGRRDHARVECVHRLRVEPRRGARLVRSDARLVGVRRARHPGGGRRRGRHRGVEVPGRGRGDGVAEARLLPLLRAGERRRRVPAHGRREVTSGTIEA